MSLEGLVTLWNLLYLIVLQFQFSDRFRRYDLYMIIPLFLRVGVTFLPTGFLHPMLWQNSNNVFKDCISVPQKD